MKIKLTQGAFKGRMVEAEPCILYGVKSYEFEVDGAGHVVPADWVTVVEMVEAAE
jgi:hypothetical protein